MCTDTTLDPGIMTLAHDAALAAGAAPEAIAEAVAALGGALWDQIAPETPPHACRSGCSWCCHQPVAVTVPEVALVVAWLHRNRDAAEMAALRLKLAGAVAERGLDARTRMAERRACPFLGETGACTIHPARPLLCRGVHSEDAGFCRRLVEDRVAVEAEITARKTRVPFLEIPKVVFASVQIGMAAAVGETLAPAGHLELSAAVAIALAQPDSFTRWRAGEPVFAEAGWLVPPKGDSLPDGPM